MAGTGGGGHGNPLQSSCLENPLDRGACWAAAHGVAESDATERALALMGVRCVSLWLGSASPDSPDAEHLVHELVHYLYTFFGKMSIQIFCSLNLAFLIEL